MGKRKFGKDWGKRVWLFDRLVWATVGYGVEIWGWRERERVECSAGEVFEMGVWGLDWCTPGYMVREELQRDMLKGEGGDEGMEL